MLQMWVTDLSFLFSALEVVRHCASQTYAKCSTSIPANSLDQLLEALSESIKCPNFYL